VRRVERWLASARVFLAIATLVAIGMDPSEIRSSLWVSGLLAFYIAQGMIIIIFLRRRQESTPSFRLLVHSADIVWPTAILVFGSGKGTSFFLFFVFVLAAAAYRWGLWETLGTAAVSVVLLWAESFAFAWGVPAWINQGLARLHMPLLPTEVPAFEPKRLFLLSIYLLVMGWLLGYLAEQQKQLRAEKALIARILGKARVEAGLAGTLQEIFSELLAMYGARQALIVSQESNSHRVFVAEVTAPKEGPSQFRWLEAMPLDRETYLVESPFDVCYARRTNGGSSWDLVAVDEDGARVRAVPTTLLDRLAERRGFQSLLSVSFIFGREWFGRMFFVDPSITGDTEEELRFLQELIRQVGPAVYNVYLLRRLRLRAGAVERARFARELHDGAVQSLIAVEMQVDVLRRQSSSQSSPFLTDELSRIQGLLREEVLKLRELMQQMKSLDVDSRKLLGFMGDTVERFQRETGIVARFHCDMEELDMPPHICRELARIVQEGLVNVRKHSQARQVLVRLSEINGRWKVTIEDDGRGFPFSGRLNQTELDEINKGPLIIKERVRLIEGELTVESNPGRGSRLEISVPQKREAAYG
jgi:signal transduction histidine kinase